jgi:hypothetical protein
MDGEFISYWSNVMSKSDELMYKLAKRTIEISKVAFTKTLNKSEWPNTEIAIGDLKDEIKVKESRRW